MAEKPERKGECLGTGWVSQRDHGPGRGTRLTSPSACEWKARLDSGCPGLRVARL